MVIILKSFLVLFFNYGNSRFFATFFGLQIFCVDTITKRETIIKKTGVSIDGRYHWVFGHFLTFFDVFKEKKKSVGRKFHKNIIFPLHVSRKSTLCTFLHNFVDNFCILDIFFLSIFGK